MAGPWSAPDTVVADVTTFGKWSAPDTVITEGGPAWSFPSTVDTTDDGINRVWYGKTDTGWVSLEMQTVG